MTLSLAITINRTALLRIVVTLFEASGLGAGKSNMLSRILRSTVLDQLRTAEAAGRRLVAAIAEEMAARGVTLKPRAKGTAPTQPIPRGDGTRVPPFALFDPRKKPGAGKGQRFAKGVGPRMFCFDGSDPVIEPAAEKPAVSPDDLLDAAGLCRRLQALKNALEDPAKQARRLLRMQAGRTQAGGPPKRPMRPGRPPGHRARRRYEVDEILYECHQLALRAMAAPDTS